MRSRDQRSPLIATTDTLLVGPNPRRVAIVISGPPTNRFTVSFGGAAVLDQGITQYPLAAPLVLDHDVWG